MAMLTYVKRSGARPVGSQAGTASGPQPQRGPTTDTGLTQGEGSRRRSATDQPQETALPVTPAVPLVFAQWNAEGLRNKKPELQIFLKKHQVDIICIQETHLTDAHRFFIRGYQLFRHDRTNRHKGGLVTLVRNTIPAVQTGQSDGDYTEFLTVKVMLQDRDITVANCYCPPDRDLKLHTIPLRENGFLAVGDFNGHSPSWGYQDLNSRGEQIEDWMLDSQLILINKPDDKPTCLSRAWKTTSHPDLAMATEDIHKQCARSVEDQLGGSDHLPILLHLTSTGPPPTARKVPSWNFKRANWQKYKELTDKFCEDVGTNDDQSLNDIVSAFTSAILKAASQSIPRGRRADYKPYWSSNLQKLHSQLTEAREELENHPSPENNAAYTKARSAFDEEKTRQTQQSWREKTADLNMENDTAKLWRLLKSLNEDHQATRSPTVLAEDNKHLTGKLAANVFADNFQEDSTLNIPREREAEVRNEIRQELRKAAPSVLMTDDFTLQELNAAVRRLKNRKSPGKDGVTNEMIKNLGSHSKQKLLDIFNQSWRTGFFPCAWKEAILVPVPKKGKNRHSKNGYRPISLLSCLGKTMERIVNRRLQYHLEKNGLISPAQSGFRKNRSTEDQIAYLTQEIENAFQQKMKTLAVFVDLTKAFDKVWKEGLLLKLLKKKVCGRMYSWIQSYLFQRTARVKLDGHQSKLVKMREGVPQGGVISPTLFIVFIDDIADELRRHISRALHADDLALWTASEYTTTASHRMQESMNSISEWANRWLVTINRIKTVATCFSLSPNKEKFSLQIDGEEVPQQDTPTYLGVTLDRKLTWTPHISVMENKSMRKMAIMKKLAGTRWGANSRILKQAYTGSVRPHLEYASTSWSTAARTNTAKLGKVQNAALRLITGGMKTTPITAMEGTARLHSLEERREEKILRQAEKMKRIPSHPLRDRLQELTKNRLKRQSLNHLSKALQRQHADTLPKSPQNVEPLQDYEEFEWDDLNIIADLPGMRTKEEHSPVEMRTLTLETLDRDFPSDQWTHVYTDGSAESAVKNGGGGVYIRFPDGSCMTKSIPAGQLSTNFRAEACALLEAASALNASEKTSPSTVFLTDCKSLLQSLQGSNNRDHELLRNIRRELHRLGSRTTLILQWIPSHCGVRGNEEADRLSKAGSRMNQTEHPVSFPEVKSILKNCFHAQWKNRMGANTEDDDIERLTRAQQVVIFRLRTGHCRLLAHLCRLRISHTDECPCGTGTQTPEHVLQTCPTFSDLREKFWPQTVDLKEKLWGRAESLRLTADFAISTDLTI